MDEGDADSRVSELARMRLLNVLDEDLENLKSSWQFDFITEGGVDHLLKIFNEISRKKTISKDFSNKIALSNILKIFKNYLTAVYASSVSNIYRTTQFISMIHLSLDSISDYLRESSTSLLPKTERKISMELEVVRKDSHADSDLPLNRKGSLYLEVEGRLFSLRGSRGRNKFCK
jgi:hypothetical protein